MSKNVGTFECVYFKNSVRRNLRAHELTNRLCMLQKAVTGGDTIDCADSSLFTCPHISTWSKMKRLVWLACNNDSTVHYTQRGSCARIPNIKSFLYTHFRVWTWSLTCQYPCTSSFFNPEFMRNQMVSEKLFSAIQKNIAQLAYDLYLTHCRFDEIYWLIIIASW